MALFNTLSTRSLPSALVLHPQSCCPTTDVAVLSNPTNATANASIQLYRLSGDSDAAGTSSATTSESTSSTSQVWATALEQKAVVVVNDVAATSSYIQPRLPETLVWHPEGTMFAFASAEANYMLYSMHDGRPTLKKSPFGRAQEGSIYLLAWERTLCLGSNLPREQCTAQILESQLPKLSEIRKVHEKTTVKTGTFVNPFAAGFSKPYVPTVNFTLQSFPTLPRTVASAFESQGSEDEVDLVPDDSTKEALRLVENPSLLLCGHEDGSLHLLLEGAIDLGSVKLGPEVDIVSASLTSSTIHPKTPFRRVSYSTNICVLASIPSTATDTCHTAISRILPRQTPVLQDASTVAKFNLHLPNFPSPEISQLAQASTSIRKLLAHAFEAFDEGRKAWEEVRGMSKKWLGRLQEDSQSPLPEMQLLTLLLTGRPSNTNMHEYFASKNTERSLEHWEASHLKVTARLRALAYQSIVPVCERLTLWLEQLRGWQAWPQRYGHLLLNLEDIEDCLALINLLLVRATLLEDMSLEEETGYREFSGWLKFDLERIAAIEANSESRPSPRHDVLVVARYIRQKMTKSDLDTLLLVEVESEQAPYGPVLASWLGAYKESNASSVSPQNLPDLQAVFQAIHEKWETQTPDESAINVKSSLGFQDEGSYRPRGTEMLFLEPEQFIPKRQSTSNRRKSTLPQDIKARSSLNALELPLAYLLSELSQRLNLLLDRSFKTVASSAIIREAQPIITWQPLALEEDDAMAALGLARDPTKITSRVVKGSNEGDGDCLYIACETPPGSLAWTHDACAAFWIYKITPNTTYAQAFALTTEQDRTSFDILDIDFFDDAEVALLLRHTHTKRFSLATVAIQQTALAEGPLDRILEVYKDFSLPPIPLHRVHTFESSFEPLQFSLNGREGRRIAVILGNAGRVLEVLDMDEPEDEDATSQEGHEAFDER